MAWHTIKVATAGYANPTYAEFMLDDENDILTEPDWSKFLGYEPGMSSVAYSNKPGAGAAMSKMWMRSSTGTWEEM